MSSMLMDVSGHYIGSDLPRCCGRRPIALVGSTTDPDSDNTVPQAVEPLIAALVRDI